MEGTGEMIQAMGAHAPLTKDQSSDSATGC